MPVARFDEPVQALAAPVDRARLFVVERRGRVRVIRRGTKLRRPFLDLSGVVDIRRPGIGADHGGLLSIAFAPGYAHNRRLYAFYTHSDGALRVEEFRRAPGSRDRALRASGRVLFSLPTVSRFHFGGQLAFGPDRLLYVGLGDQAQDHEAQRLDSLRGKIVRVDPRQPGAQPEIFALGLRNPFRFSFGRRGALLVGDVGDATTEELDVIPRTRAGANLGWNRFEGRRRVRPGEIAGHLLPALTKPHSRGFCSITAGLLVRDRSLGRLFGRFLYTDLCFGRLRSVRIRGTTASRDRAERPYARYPVHIGEDARRRIHVVSLAGPLLRLVNR